jgi:hypothetical protein
LVNRASDGRLLDHFNGKLTQFPNALALGAGLTKWTSSSMYDLTESQSEAIHVDILVREVCVRVERH